MPTVVRRRLGPLAAAVAFGLAVACSGPAPPSAVPATGGPPTGSGGSAAVGPPAGPTPSGATTRPPSPATPVPATRSPTPPGTAAGARLTTARLGAGASGLQVDIAYPQLAGMADAAVQQRINRRMRRWARHRRDEFVTETSPVREESSPGPVPLSVTTTVAEGGVGAGLVSVVLVEETYLGGAHSMLAAHGLTFDLGSGRRLPLGRLLGEGDGGRLAERVVDALAAQEGTWDTARLEEAVDAAAMDAFAVSRDGLVVYFDQYEVGPGALGVVPARVGSEALAGLLDPDGPAAALAGR